MKTDADTDGDGELGDGSRHGDGYRQTQTAGMDSGLGTWDTGNGKRHGYDTDTTQTRHRHDTGTTRTRHGHDTDKDGGHGLWTRDTVLGTRDTGHGARDTGHETNTEYLSYHVHASRWADPLSGVNSTVEEKQILLAGPFFNLTQNICC